MSLLLFAMVSHALGQLRHHDLKIRGDGRWPEKPTAENVTDALLWLGWELVALGALGTFLWRHFA